MARLQPRARILGRADYRDIMEDDQLGLDSCIAVIHHSRGSNCLADLNSHRLTLGIHIRSEYAIVAHMSR